MIKFNEYCERCVESVSVDSDLILRAMLGVVKKEEAPFIDEYILTEARGTSLYSAGLELARAYASEVADALAPYVCKVDGKVVFKVEPNKDAIPSIFSLEEFNHFKPHHTRMVVLTEGGNDAELREAMEKGEGEYERIYESEDGWKAYAYFYYPYRGRAIADCMEHFAEGLSYRLNRLELPEDHPVGLSDWQVFEELKTGNRVAAMVKPGDVNSAFLNVTELPYMRGKHPEHGHVLIVGASRHGNAEAAILTYAKACGVELEKPTEPQVWDEIPF